MATLKFKRGTQAQLDTAAGNSELNVGEPYLVTDVGYIAVGTAVNAYGVCSLNLTVVLESTDSDPSAGAYPDGTLIYKKL